MRFQEMNPTNSWINWKATKVKVNINLGINLGVNLKH